MTAICIIGGGAAGMAAAISAAEADPSLHVTILEKKNQLGKKILATGNGRCNLSNTACAGYAQTLDFFADLGLLTRTDPSGRIYPYTEEARAVRDALDQKIRYLGIEVLLNAEAASLDKGEQGFFIHLENRDVFAHKLLLACGGKAGSAFGSTGDGFRFAREVGHKVTPCFPSLVPLEVREEWVKELQGLSLKNVELTITDGRKELYRGFGEMMFTHFGVTGPLVLTASTLIQKRLSDHPLGLRVDLKPALAREQLDQRILREFDQGKNRQFKNVLGGLFPSKLIPVMIRQSGILPEKPVHEITREERQRLVELTKGFPLTVTALRGYNEAVVTRGGVDVREMDPSTMESKKVQNLYFAGEVLDLDALTGGFNLQIAWSTGYAAGRGYREKGGDYEL